MPEGGAAATHRRPMRRASSPPDSEAVTAELERILANGDFDASPRSRLFVRFVVEEALAGRHQDLTQAAIAVKVFGRREGFDLTVDPIVCIQAGRLRRSLERYYLLAGASDPVRIELPRGTYAPVFRWGSGDSPAGPADATPAAEDRGGWPTIVLGARSGGGEHVAGESAATPFLDHLSVELDRYRDVRVVLGPETAHHPPGHGARFALTAQVRDVDGRARVAVRLVDGRTGRQVWAEEYRESRDKAAGFLRETAMVVAARVASEHGIVAQTLLGSGALSEAEETTYGALLRSYRLFLAREPSDLVPALGALRRAVAEEPECAIAWVQLSRLHVVNYAFEVAPAADTSIEQGLAFAQHAARLDPSSQRARAALAFALLVKDETTAGLAEARTALALNPETFVYLETIGWLLSLLGDWEQGTALVRKAIARNPHYMPVGHHALWADHLRAGDVEEAHQAAVLYQDSAFFWRSLMRASCLGHLGRLEEARAEAAELLRTKPDFARRGRTLIGRLLKLPDLRQRVADGLAKAGLVLG